MLDEFHHAAARSYRRLIGYFEPRFLLGLTATPQRTDGAPTPARTISFRVSQRRADFMTEF